MKRMEDDLTSGMWAVLIVTATAGLLLSFAALLDRFLWLQVAAGSLWFAGLAAFVGLTHRKARREGTGFWRSAGRTLRRFLRVVLDTTFP